MLGSWKNLTVGDCKILKIAQHFFVPFFGSLSDNHWLKPTIAGLRYLTYGNRTPWLSDSFLTAHKRSFFLDSLYIMRYTLNYSMAQYFTEEGLKELKEELKRLKTVEVKRVTKLIAEAAAFGDLKENAAYHDARNMKSFLLGRIEQLENAINDAIIIKKKEDGKIQVGSRVVIIFDGKKETYHIVAPGEADILKNKLSYQSPLGQKLMGQVTGNEFNYEVKGNKMKVKVVSVT